MKSATVIIAALAAAHCCSAVAGDQEFQLTPRVGPGAIRVDNGFRAGRVSGGNPTLREENTLGVGGAVGYVTPLGLMLEVGAEGQSNFTFGGTFERLTFSEQYVAAGYQLEFGNGFRLTPKVGRTRWRLSSKEGRFFNSGRESSDSIDGYEDFWDVSLTKSVRNWFAMGVRYRSTEYTFGRIESAMFVTTFNFR